jgi:hypothetical protein
MKGALIMNMIHPWLLALVIGVAVLAVLVSETIRRLAIALVFIGALWAGYRVFIRSAECSKSDGPCHVQLSPTWASICWSSSNAALEKQGGYYHLVSDGLHNTDAHCADARFWDRPDTEF